MPTNRELEIILKLRDELTKKLKSAETAINAFVTRMGNLGSTFSNFGRTINQIGTKLTMFGSIITGGFLLALRNAADYSLPVSRALNEIKNSALNLQIVIAQAVVPVLQKLSNFIASIVTIFQNMNPQLRESILQWAFMVGIWLTATGVLFKFGGAILTVIGKTLTLAKNMYFLAAANWPVTLGIMAIVAALILMIKYWSQVRAMAIPVINAMQIGVDMLAIGVLRVVDFIFMLYEKMGVLKDVLKLMIEPLVFLKMIPREVADSYKNALDSMTQNTQEMRATVQAQIQMLQDDIQSIMEQGTGAWAENVDEMIAKIQFLFEQLKNLSGEGINKTVQDIYGLKQFVDDIAPKIAQAMESHLGNFFYNTLTQQITSAKQLFADFGKAILQILTQAIAKLILVKTLGAALEPVFGFNLFKAYHQGGVIRKHLGGIIRAHQGLAVDEVPIIALRGEGILSRRGMSALGGERSLNRLNQGNSLGGNQEIHYHPTLIIKAWDAADVMQHSPEIKAIFADAMRTQSRAVKGSIKRYG